MTTQRIERNGDQRVGQVPSATPARLRAGRWALLAGMALFAPGCAMVDMLDSTEPVSRPRGLTMRPAPVPGSITARRSGQPTEFNAGRTDEDILGPQASVRSDRSSPVPPPVSPSARSPGGMSADLTAVRPGVGQPSVPLAMVNPGSEVRPEPLRVDPVVEPEVVPEPSSPRPAPAPIGSNHSVTPEPHAVPAPEIMPEVKPEVRPEVRPEVAVTPSTTQPSAEAGVATPPAADPAVVAKTLSPEQQKLRARIEELKNQIKSGIDVNEKDDKGRTLLQQASITGDLEIVELLLDWGANVRAVDRQGWTALHWAASSGHQEICELLIASGTPVDSRGWLDDSALHWAAVFDRRDVAELLIARGADVNLVDKRGRTALHAAVENDARATAAVLIAQGADLKLRDESGLTPLHTAVLQCRKALVDLASGEFDGSDATPAAAKTHGDRPANNDAARQAIVTRSHEMVKLLLTKGADVNAATPRGVTPLHLAAWDDTREIAELLVSMGADPLAKDARDRTPQDYAKLRSQGGVSTVLAVVPR